MDTAAVITLVGTLVGVGGISGAIVAIVKLRPEAGQIVVRSAEGAVIIQASVIDTLQDEVQRLTERLSQVEETARVAHVEAEEMKAENAYLKRRVGLLEAENIELREQVSIVKDKQNGRNTPDE